MTLSLSDALSEFRAVSDTTHRFWGYFQVVAGGTAAFAWAANSPDLQLFCFLSAAFAIFAIFNWRLVFLSQREAETAAECVKAHARRLGDAVPAELRALAEVKPDPAHAVGWWHAILSVATLVAVWWGYYAAA